MVELHRRDVVTYRDVGESVGLGLIRVRASQEERPGVPFRRYRTADGWEWRQVRP